MRFRPPACRLDADVRWLLVRAFAPRGFVSTPPADPARALALAKTLDLGARIAARNPPDLLARAIGEDHALVLATHHLAAEVAERRLLDAAAWIAAQAGRAGIPVTFLKFVGLRLAGASVPGGRMASDVDVLAPDEATSDLQRALVAGGASTRDLPGYDHQLPLLGLPGGEFAEVHRYVPGLRLTEAKRFARWADLDGAGLLRPVTLPGPDAGGARASRPEDRVLAAHALLHGLGQNGMAPESYPLTRMLADLADLAARAPNGGPLDEDGMRWVGRGLPMDEAKAALALVRRLAEGTPPPAGGALDADDADRLLAHVLLGRLDATYARSLRLGQIAERYVEGSRAAAWWKTVRGALAPTDAQLDGLHGRAGGRVARVRRRAARPFHLLFRAGRAAWSALRIRLRGPA